VAGGIVWATTFSVLGYFVGNSWYIIKIYLGRLGIFAFIIGAIIIYLYFLFTKRRRLIKEKVGWIDKRMFSQMPKTWEFVKRRFSAGEWYGWNLTISLVFLILALFSFGEIAEDLIDKETLFYLDLKVQKLVESITSPAITRFMVDITNIGGVYLIAIIAAAMVLNLFYRRYWWDLFAFFIAVGFGEMLLIILKLFFHRPRPSPQIISAHGYAFPSSHAFTAMIVCGFLIYMTWKLIKVKALRYIVFFFSGILIILVGISRVYLNVHWLSDVLGGYTAGVAWLLFSIVIINTVRQMTSTKRDKSI
jgi:undecaprenyl-diphosphatase